MFKKLFGETESEQEKYLKIRVIASIIAIIFLAIDLLFIGSGISEYFCVIVFWMWGWSILKALWGVTSILSIFSVGKNFAVTIIILVLYFTMGYFAGIAILPIGVYRYISLIVKKKAR